MDGKKFLYADKEKQVEKINHFVAIGIAVFYLMVMAVVLASCLRGIRSVGYAVAFLVLVVLSGGMNFILFYKNKRSVALRYVCLVGLLLVTAMLCWAFDAYYMRFMAIIPFIGCILYFDLRFSAIAAILVTVLNFSITFVKSFVTKVYQGESIIDNICASGVILVAVFICTYATLIAKWFNEHSLERLKEESESQKEMAKEVMQIAKQVRKGTEDARGIVNEVRESSEITSRSAGDISQSTTVTAENIQTQTIMTQNIQENIEKTVERAEHMVQAATLSSEINEKNQRVMTGLKEQAKELADTNAQVAEAMTKLQENAENVKSITQTIFSISSQTNLLALNASIESARAGEAGKGFAVVAEQIRELSERTRNETENIKTVLEELNLYASQTAQALDKSVEVSREQERMITEASEQFEEMNRNVGELAGDIKEIDDMLERLSDANNQIVDNIIQLSATTQEVTAAAQQSADMSEKNRENALEAQELLDRVLEVSQQMNKYMAE